MSLNLPELQRVHALSFSNARIIEAAGSAVCFNCGKQSDFGAVTDAVKDPGSLTLLCPHCGVDALLPIIGGDLLTQLHNHYL